MAQNTTNNNSCFYPDGDDLNTPRQMYLPVEQIYTYMDPESMRVGLLFKHPWLEPPPVAVLNESGVAQLIYQLQGRLQELRLAISGDRIAPPFGLPTNNTEE